MTEPPAPDGDVAPSAAAGPPGWEAVPTVAGPPTTPVTRGTPAGVPARNRNRDRSGPRNRSRNPLRSRRPRSTRRLLALVGGGAVVAAAVVLLTLALTASADRYAPARQVDAFFDALEAGHARHALALASVDPGNDPLLTDAAYARATDRITAHRVVATRTGGGLATVEVAVTRGGHRTTTTIDLVADGSAGLFSHHWRIQSVDLGSVTLAVDGPRAAGVVVAGRTVRPAGGTVTLRALPGRYPVSLTADPSWTAPAGSVTVAGLDGQGAQLVLHPTLTATGAGAARAAVQRWVAGCVASTALIPPGCSFGTALADPSVTYEDQRWRLDTAPVVTVGAWTGTGWAIRTTTPGTASFSAAFTSVLGTGTASAGPVPFAAVGVVTDVGESGVPVFHSSLGNGSGGGVAS